MKKMSFLFFVLVPMLNIFLNITVRKAAGKSSSFLGAVLSPDFAVSFLIGMSSVLCMLALYLTGVSLARGVLIMGAISIVGGSLYGVLVHRNILVPGEWCLLAVIVGLLAYRWSLTT